MVSISQLQDIPSENMILLVGPPGAGKSTFCHQTVLRNIEMSPVIYVTTESAPSRVVESFREKRIGVELIILVRIVPGGARGKYPIVQANMPWNLTAEVLQPN